MHVTILGASAAGPNPGGACSGYLVEGTEQRLLLECGPGVLSRLQRHVSLRELDAIVISHAHVDHYLDLVAVRQTLVHQPFGRRGTRLPVYVDEHLAEALSKLEAVLGDPEYWSRVLEVSVYDPERPLVLGDIRIGFARANHYVPCWAMRLACNDRLLAYTADTGPSDRVAALATGADLLIAECTLPEGRAGGGEPGHLAPDDAGAMAAKAGVDRLMLTHYWSAYDPERLRLAAAKVFGGAVHIAREDERHDV